MTLDDFLKLPGKSAKELAAATGLSEASISRLRTGGQRPSAGALEEIFKATRGAVTPNDFFGIAA